MAQVRILIVEDEVLVAEDIRARLLQAGYDVPAVVDNADTALQVLHSRDIDLVLMDIRLTGETDGIQLAENILSTRPMPIIYLSSLTDKTTVERAVKTHPAAYMVKPFVGRELFIAIDVAMANFIQHARPEKEKTAPAVFGDRIFVKHNQRFERINIQDILWLQAEDNYTEIITADKKYLMSLTLGTFFEKLDNPLFMRVHRSYAVNLDKVDAFQGGRLFVGKQEIPVSQASRETLTRYFQAI